MCTRATAPLCVYPCFCYRSCRRRSCQCGLHKQAARAKVARSSAQPKGLRSASRRQSRRSCSASRPGRRARSRPHRTARRRPVRLAPSSGSPAGGSASAATGVCCAVTLRTAPSPLRAAPSAVFPRAPQAPYQGLAPQGDEMNEKNIHPCRSNSAFVHSSEKMLITSRRFARSVAPCIKAFHAEKNARTATPSAHRPSSRSAPRRCCGRCRPGSRRPTCRPGRGRTP